MMFFGDLIKRKLTSLLRPWLRRDEELELELKLGFLRSNGVLRNLRFNTSALNELLDDPSRLRFKDVTVEQLTVRVSNWLTPTFTFQVHGLHISLSVGEEEEEEGGVRQRRKARDTSGEDMEKLLAELDPEGSALHDAIKRISNLSGRSWKNSLYSSILGRCWLQICEINVLVQSPCSNDLFLLSLEIKELGVKPQFSLRGSQGGFTSSLFVPCGESSFHLDVKGLEIGLRSKSSTSSIVPSTDLFTSVTLKNLQFTNIIFSAPSLNFSFSPTDFSIILLFYVLSSRLSNYARNGRQLWRIAASRISSLIPIPKLSLHRVVRDVCLWLQYLHSYENMLLLVGYPEDDRIRRSATMVFRDRTFSRSFRNQLKVISEIEKEIPAETIAQARRIARYKAASSAHRAKDLCDDSQANSRFWKIYQLLAFIWNVTCGVFYSLTRVLFLRKVVTSHRKTNEQLEAIPEDPLQPCCIALKVGEFSISVSPQLEVWPPIRGKLFSEVGLPYEDLLSFRLSVDAFFFRYSQNSFKQCLTFASGCFKVVSSSVMKDGLNDLHTYTGQGKKKFHNTQTVLWSEPAQFICSAETIGVNPARKTGEASIPHVEIGCRIGKLWSNWKKLYQSIDEYTMQNLENPSIICESKSFLTAQSLKGRSYGFWDCGLVVGKFNFLLEYSSIVSIAVLSRQMQLALCGTNSSKRMNIVLHSPTTMEDLPVIDWNSKYKSYSRRIEMEMFRLLPQKHIQIGALIAGPHIQISVGKENFHGINADLYHIIQKDEVQISFDVHDIELVVSPNVGLVSASSSGHEEVCYAQLKGCGLKVPQEIDFVESDSKNNTHQGEISFGVYLKINGLRAYVGESSEIPEHHIVMLSPTTIGLSSLRKNGHSFGSTAVAFSAAFQWMTSAFTTILFLDELFVLVKVVSGLFYALKCAFALFDSVGGMSCQGELRQVTISEENLLNRVKQAPSVVTDIMCVISTSFELKSIRMVLSDSRRSYDVESHMSGIDTVTRNKLGIHDMPVYGTHIFVQRLTLELSLEEEKAEVVFDLTEVQSMLFRYSTEVSDIFDQIKLENLLRSLNCLSEASCSHCKLSLCLRTLQKAWHSASLSNRVDASTSCAPVSDMHENSPLVMDADRSNNQSSNWLLALLSLDEIYIVGCPAKNILAREHKSNNLDASLSIAGLFQAISCQSEGGSVFLETTSLVMFVRCFTSYIDWIKNLSAAAPLSEERVVRHGEDMASIDNHPSPQMWQPCQIKSDLLEAFSMDLSQLSLALVASDVSGKVEELLFEINTHLDLRVLNMARKASFVVSKLSILSLSLGENMEEQNLEIRSPQFSSAMSVDSSSISLHEDPSVALKHGYGVVHEDASSSSRSISQNEYYANDPGKSNNNHTGLHICSLEPQNFILKESTVFLTVEWPVRRDSIDPLCPNEAWVGNGSISDLELTVSLRELQMILFAVQSMSELSTEETSNDVSLRHWSASQESQVRLEERVPDGTIIAVQDVYQHMYIVVEGAESRYNLGGAVHYSLMGERALFRVKYHKARWKSQIQYFSLLSLFAKSDSGEPLRLNCRSRSDFLDISGSDDSAWSLWRVFPYEVEAYEGDIEWDSYRPLGKNTFSLVNRKNDRSVAFIDGLWEFTSKPGNPFKMKVLHDPSPSSNLISLDRYSMAASGTTLEYDSQMNDKREMDKAGKLSGIVVTIGKVSLTIVHELSNSTEKFPLLQGSINSTDVIVQIFNTKARVMSTLGILLHYFDAQRNMWRELVSQLEICIFYRSKFSIQGSENVLDGVPVHFYARIDELNISVSERSLDLLLFVIGKLNLAGPYAIRSSTILANCCKVENQSGLSLLCQFNNDQNVSIAGQQSVTIFLRHLASRNQRAEPSFFSVGLGRGPLSTSLIHLPLVQAEAVAWRTRIVSSQETKTFPGPFIVVEVSRTTEDGMSITLSPLLRIHNETDFSMELRFQRPEQKETEFASLMLKAGDTIDDSMAAFGAINFSGGSKKALISLGVGNFVFSFRPNCTDDLENGKISSVEWSEDLKGGKPVRLSGIFDKLTYQVRKAFSIKALKSSLSTAHCALKFEDGRVANIHFLIQSTGREIPVIQKDSSGHAPASSSVALQEQKEIFLLPTVHVSNLLHTQIHVNLTDRDPQASAGYDNIGSQATIPGGSNANLYANPSTIYFVVTLTSFDSSCKPVNSSDWVKKLEKQKNTVRHLDIELDFGGGKYFAFLRLSRGHRGMLEAAIFTSYTLANDTDYSLFCFSANQKPPSRAEVEKLGPGINLESGSYLPPNTTRSWLMKSPKVRLKLLEEKALGALLDLDAISGLTEIDLEIEDRPGCRNITKLGVSLRPPTSEVVPSQIVSMKPRYVVLNESEQIITVRQCYFEGDTEGIIAINSKQRATLKLQTTGVRKKRETTVLENFLKKHTKAEDDSLLHIQFRPDETGLGWSGPVCIASLGRFFLKFRRSVESAVSRSDNVKLHEPKLCEFAAVHVAEEGSTIVLHFHKPPNINLPYRIENCLRDSPVTYYQKDLFEPEILGSGASVDYVWDNLTLPHKLVVQIDDVHLLREINLDKLREWKPFYKINQNRGLGFQLPMSKKPEDQKRDFGRFASTETVKLGYEVYADGLTRVLRISEFSDRRNEDTVIPSSSKMRLKISNFTIQLLERARQDMDMSEQSTYTPLIATRLRNMKFDSMSTGLQKFTKIRVQSLSVDQKWVGAPFAAMLRRHQSESYDANDSILHVALVLLPPRSGVKQVKYLSIVLQPLDLNIDEETLMRIIPFWRTSLSDSPSQQYYFDHFEIHPIKIVASFLPGDSYTSYSSTQEAMRSLLHSVIKIPAIKNMNVELNGVLVTHALITLRELSIRCAQHYSWYALRAIYIAKGSPLLPPVFASIFDDLSSSSLDVFFDPSSGLINLPGLTIGTFKLISKCIGGKGSSGTKRYFGDLGKTLKSAGSNILFAAVTEVSDSILKGAETNGWNGMLSGFHQGILKLAMEPSVLGSAFMEGGPDRKIKLDRSPGVDELYIEGYLQAMLDTMYKQEYLRVRVLDNQVVLKNLPPNSSLVNEIMERVKGFLVSKALLKGDSSTTSHSLRHIRGESEWKLGPTVLTLCEHLFVSFAIRFLRKRAGKVISKVRWKEKSNADDTQAVVSKSGGEEQKVKLVWKWGIGKFVLSGIVAYIDGRLCRSIPNPLARRVVSGFLLSFLDNNDDK